MENKKDYSEYFVKELQKCLEEIKERLLYSDEHDLGLASLISSFKLVDEFVLFTVADPPQNFGKQFADVIEFLEDLHDTIETYLVCNIYRVDINMSAVINLLNNLVLSSLYSNRSKLQRGGELGMSDANKHSVNDLIFQIERIEYLLAFYTSNDALLNILEKYDTNPFQKYQHNLDGRNKLLITSSQKAYVIHKLFNRVLHDLNKHEKKLVLEYITGNTGNTVYNELTGKSLSPTLMQELDKKFQEIDSKIKATVNSK